MYNKYQKYKVKYKNLKSKQRGGLGIDKFTAFDVKFLSKQDPAVANYIYGHSSESIEIKNGAEIIKVPAPPVLIDPSEKDVKRNIRYYASVPNSIDLETIEFMKRIIDIFGLQDVFPKIIYIYSTDKKKLGYGLEWLYAFKNSADDLVLTDKLGKKYNLSSYVDAYGTLNGIFTESIDHASKENNEYLKSEFMKLIPIEIYQKLLFAIYVLNLWDTALRNIVFTISDGKVIPKWVDFVDQSMTYTTRTLRGTVCYSWHKEALLKADSIYKSLTTSEDLGGIIDRIFAPDRLWYKNNFDIDDQRKLSIENQFNIVYVLNLNPRNSPEENVEINKIIDDNNIPRVVSPKEYDTPLLEMLHRLINSEYPTGPGHGIVAYYVSMIRLKIDPLKYNTGGNKMMNIPHEDIRITLLKLLYEIKIKYIECLASRKTIFDLYEYYLRVRTGTSHQGHLTFAFF
ncbi:MAG: hypothetical protein Hyperionvirus29_24 [Hyperionvirus sp.]|uniref:Uncharacterized protein n=1 Tax=Hyperionvirus sp. TaxID=2487770 RepID=A0A3G5AE71_9VIRU|nr:MAG: hypothetical protein Hyperionvirus29_24 [Hyperionvirus sp.]